MSSRGFEVEYGVEGDAGTRERSGEPGERVDPRTAFRACRHLELDDRCDPAIPSRLCSARNWNITSVRGIERNWSFRTWTPIRSVSPVSKLKKKSDRRVPIAGSTPWLAKPPTRRLYTPTPSGIPMCVKKGWGSSGADAIPCFTTAERIALMVSSGVDPCAASATGRISNAHANIVNASDAFKLGYGLVDICTTPRV